MKCIKNGKGEIRRVEDSIATSMVANGDWKYCPKSDWKAKKGNRVSETAAPVIPIEKKEKTNKKSKKNKKDAVETEVSEVPAVPAPTPVNLEPAADAFEPKKGKKIATSPKPPKAKKSPNVSKE